MNEIEVYRVRGARGGEGYGRGGGGQRVHQIEEYEEVGGGGRIRVEAMDTWREREGRGEERLACFQWCRSRDRIVRTVLSSLVGSGPTAPSPFSGELEEESCAAAQPGVPSA